MKRFLTSVSLQHEPKASDVITLVKKTFFARVSYEILYHEVWKCGFPHAKDFRTRSVRKTAFSHTEWNKTYFQTIFPRKRPISCEENDCLIFKTTQNVLLVLVYIKNTEVVFFQYFS